MRLYVIELEPSSGLPDKTDQILRELRRLRDDVRTLQEALIQVVEPSQEEKKAIREGRSEIRRGRYTDWKTVRRELRQ